MERTKKIKVMALLSHKDLIIKFTKTNNYKGLFLFVDNCFQIFNYSLSPGFWQSFVTIGVHKDHIPALA